MAQLHALLKQEVHRLPPPPGFPATTKRAQSLHAVGSATRTKHRLQARNQLFEQAGEV